MASPIMRDRRGEVAERARRGLDVFECGTRSSKPRRTSKLLRSGITSRFFGDHFFVDR